MSDLAGQPLTLSLPAQVHLAARIVASETEYAAILEIAKQDAARAQRVLEENGSGVQIVFSDQDFLRLSPDLESAIQPNGNCSAAGSLQALGGTVGYASGQLTVYYLRWIGPVQQGLTCSRQARGVSYIKFVHDPLTLAHEIGHSLGLDKPAEDLPNLEAALGDVNKVEGFPDTEQNLMNDEADPERVGTLSLGQIYRIHFDAEGFLGSLAQSDGSRPGCPDNPYTRWPCPPLTLQVPRGWP